MKTAGRFIVMTAFAVVLHLLLGWEWTVAAAFVAGFWTRRHGWLFGAAVVFADYAALVGYSYSVDARAVAAMTEVMGALLGNMPSAAIVAITLFVGAALGAFGGAAGAQLRALADVRREGKTVTAT